MKSLLNNQWVIVVLCGIAVLMLFRSIMSPKVPSIGTADDITEFDWLDTESVSERAAIVGAELQKVNTEGLYWGDRPLRDPFSDKTRFNADDVKSIHNQAIAKMGDINSAALKLSALVSGQVSRLAVINGVIVQEGDWFNQYKISRIDKNGVWVYDGEYSRKLYLVEK